MSTHAAPSPESHEVIPYFLGGVVLGAVAIAVCAVIDGAIIALANKLVANDICGVGLPQGVIALIGVLAVIVSIATGFWIMHLRRWIGTKSDPDDHQWVALIRRHFTIGAFVVYVPLTPAVWAVVLAASNCAG